MSMDALNQAIAAGGGTWVKLRNTEDPPVEGKVVEFTERDRTDPDGNIVYKKGTTNPRKEWVFTLSVTPTDADDDGVRKLALNESGQMAVREAIREAGGTAQVGGTLKVGVKADPEDQFSQATYQAKYTPAIELPDSEF